MLITSLVYQYWKAFCFHFSFETPPIWKRTRLSTQWNCRLFFFSLRYHGYHTEFGKYCLYLWLTRKKMNFQNQIIGPGLIYFSLVFWPFSSPKSHVDIQSRVVSVCLMNNLTSSAPPLICKEWEHWTQETRNGLWSNHPRKGSCQITPWFLTTCYIVQQKPCPKTYQMISKHSLSRKY